MKKILSTCLLLCLTACIAKDAPSHIYAPLFDDAVAASKSHPPGTIGNDFATAASATTLAEATLRWEEFLKKHPADKDTGDAVEQRYINAAMYELARVYYLSGRTMDGDRLIKQADPLDLR